MESTTLEQETVEISWAHLRMPPFPQVALEGPATGLQRKRAAGQAGRADLLRSGLCQRGPHHRQLARCTRRAIPSRAFSRPSRCWAPRHLQGLCLTVGVRAYLGKSLGHPTMRTLWRHNLACALIAQQIASAGFMDREIAYTAGVLHGIGLLGLAVVRPSEYIHLLGTHIGTAASLLERRASHLRHRSLRTRQEAGSRLATCLRTSRRSCRPPCPDGPATGQWDMPEIVGLSCRMADAAGFAPFSACHSASFEELPEELPPRERKLFHTEVETLDFRSLQKDWRPRSGLSPNPWRDLGAPSSGSPWTGLRPWGESWRMS